MSLPERGRTYLEVESDKIRAATPVEFRQLLDHIRMLAGLTPSQISIKTTIPRSQAYNMVAAGRTVLPSKPGQVREFVEACGLGPVEVGLVMSLWSRLDQQAREQSAGPARSLIDRGGVSGRDWHEPVMKFSGSDVVVTTNLDRMISGHRPANRRNRTAYDMLYLILQERRFVHRALLLMLPVTLAFVSIVASLVVWAILQPDHASMIAAILGGGILLPITSSLTRLTRRSRR